MEKSILEKGIKVPIYRDPELEKGFMGVATLKTYKETGLPFILNEGSNEKEQITYALESWFIEWDLVDYKLVNKIPWAYDESRSQKIKVVYKVGL